jgi:hypothetical protein
LQQPLGLPVQPHRQGVDFIPPPFTLQTPKRTQVCDALVSGGYDFALLHVKAVDDTGHDRMVAMKVGRGALGGSGWGGCSPGTGHDRMVAMRVGQRALGSRLHG